jgi:hypothetical protein
MPSIHTGPIPPARRTRPELGATSVPSIPLTPLAPLAPRPSLPPPGGVAVSPPHAGDAAAAGPLQSAAGEVQVPLDLPQPVRLPWRIERRSPITGPMQLVLAPEVATARRPIVALESTIVAHGLPWPDNLAVARELEDTVRAGGAVPATIAVVDGIVRIGLPDELLEQLARNGARFAKAGATDLAIHLARGTSAATTVSATAMLAAKAGIRVFSTGGIGGVHRGGAADVSHDLTVLAKTPIAVVSAATSGASIRANRALAVHNAEVAAALAVALGT